MALGIWGRAAAAAILAVIMGLGMVASATAAGQISINGQIITGLQVSQRVKLFALEGNNTGQRGAQQQLINEALQLQEAKRLGITVSNAQVDAAYLNVARNLKVSADNLTKLLQSRAVNIDSLRNRLRAAIAWNGVTESAILPGAKVSDLQLDQEAAKKVNAYNSFDYILKEIIFVAPGGKGAGSRSGQANKYRQQFTGCDAAVNLSLNFTDAAVVDIGRRHATQMPDALARELAGLNVGGITKPRVIDTGVSMLAVCEKAQAEDLTFIKNDLQANVGNSSIEAAQKKYLDDLRARAKIITN